MVEIVWNKNIESDNKKEIEKYLKPYLWLIPTWCHTLRVDVDTSTDDGLLASISVQEQYRQASMTVWAKWFTSDERTKADTIIHELFHLHTNPLYDFAKNAIRKYADGKDETQMQVVFDEMECYLERQTQDLTFAVYNRFYAEEKAGFTSEQRENIKHNMNLLSKGVKKSKQKSK